MLKPMFIIFNVVTYTAYLLTIISFSLSNEAIDPATGEMTASLTAYYQVVCAINGICFLILTATLLNYGSRLEKVVSAIKIKSMVLQAR
jgi:hypothetical protein